jgi:hypothetical protein
MIEINRRRRRVGEGEHSAAARAISSWDRIAAALVWLRHYSFSASYCTLCFCAANRGQFVVCPQSGDHPRLGCHYAPGEADRHEQADD